jgi:hypothetical protein
MTRLLAAILMVAFATWPIAAMAHEGHDHGAKLTTKKYKKVKKPAKARSLLEEPAIRLPARSAFVQVPTR